MQRREVFLAFTGFSIPIEISADVEESTRECLDRVLEVKVKDHAAKFIVNDFTFCSHHFIGFQIRDYRVNAEDVRVEALQRINESLRPESWEAEDGQ